MTSATNNNNNSNGASSPCDGVNSIEEEYKKIPSRNGWQRFYQEIREKCDREANEKHFGTSESCKPQNRGLNRYRDVNPYDHSRIILHRGSIDYINANLVLCERADRKYILTQGPLGETVSHFWLMVWEQNTKAILMLNKLMEKNQIKCHLYWPNKMGAENALKLNDVKLTVEFIRCEEYKNYIRRWFKLTDLESNQSRDIIQFHYTTWPDFGIPSSPVAFLQFLKQVRDSGALDRDVGPAVVHCSAGIGRSGTFCLVDCCLVLIEKEGEHNVSVQDVLYELRRYRMGLIQTSDQLFFSYQAIIEGIKLLKDPNFLDSTEAPTICNEDQRSLEETPPPLPPRTHSLPIGETITLNLPGTQTKPLPMIPASASFTDDLYAPDQNKNALPNFINSEKNADISMSNRPLPPLPPQEQPKQQTSGSESDEKDDSENETSNEDTDNDNDSDDNDEDDDDDDKVNANNESNGNNSVTNGNATNEPAKTYDGAKTNGIEGITNSISRDVRELKRRNRATRQASIEEKVKQIKRKKHEIEEGNQAAKKRRSIVTYIAAGVIVGVICVYAYSKLA